MKRPTSFTDVPLPSTEPSTDNFPLSEEEGRESQRHILHGTQVHKRFPSKTSRTDTKDRTQREQCQRRLQSPLPTSVPSKEVGMKRVEVKQERSYSAHFSSFHIRRDFIEWRSGRLPGPILATSHVNDDFIGGFGGGRGKTSARARDSSGGPHTAHLPTGRFGVGIRWDSADTARSSEGQRGRRDRCTPGRVFCGWSQHDRLCAR